MSDDTATSAIAAATCQAQAPRRRRGSRRDSMSGQRSRAGSQFARQRRERRVETLVRVLSMSSTVHRLTSSVHSRCPSSWRARCSCALQVPTARPSMDAVSSCE